MTKKKLIVFLSCSKWLQIKDQLKETCFSRFGRINAYSIGGLELSLQISEPKHWPRNVTNGKCLIKAPSLVITNYWPRFIQILMQSCTKFCFAQQQSIHTLSLYIHHGYIHWKLNFYNLTSYVHKGPVNARSSHRQTLEFNPCNNINSDLLLDYSEEKKKPNKAHTGKKTLLYPLPLYSSHMEYFYN